MKSMLKSRTFQTGIVIAVAAAAFVAVDKLGPHHPPPTPQPVRTIHVHNTVPDQAPSDAPAPAPTDSTLSATAAQPGVSDAAAIAAGAATPPASSDATAPVSSGAATSPIASTAPTAPVPTVTVDVSGMVLRPAVYHVPASYRVVDVIKAAGGPRPEGDVTAINLAARLQDGEQIYIPTHTAVQTGAIIRQPAPPGRAPLVGPIAALPQVRRQAVTGVGASVRAPTPRSQKLVDPTQGTIDINSAGPDDLVKLPGVGPSTAAKILDFRKTNGRFTSVEDIMNVKGIGPAKFAKMRPFLVVR